MAFRKNPFYFLGLQTALFISFVSLCSCNTSLNDIAKIKSSSVSLSYNLSENGCSTGEHSFQSLESMCDGLKNDSLNNYCASQMRHTKFQSDCPGRSW